VVQIAVASGSSSVEVLQQATESFAAFHLAGHGAPKLVIFERSRMKASGGDARI